MVCPAWVASVASKLIVRARGLALGFFLLTVPLLAKGRIELVTNGICHTDHYEYILSKYDQTQEVADCDLSKFRGIRKDRSLLGKILTRLPYRIKVDPEVEKIIFMNIPQSANRSLHLEKMPKDKMVLFMWEPPIRLKKMYSPQIQKCFSKIYTFNDDLVDNETYFKLHYPSRRSMLEDLPRFEEKRFCTMIAGATNDKSKSFPSELYSHRIKAIRYFENKGEDFALYGKNWDKNIYPSYRCPIEDKLEVNKHYKFTICYENCSDLPGYVTEKIFDCFAAGSIPIYWGAPNIEDYIPKNCFIDRRDFASLEELHHFLKSMSKETYEIYLENIRAYLQSPESQVFSIENYESTFLDAIGVAL